MLKRFKRLFGISSKTDRIGCTAANNERGQPLSPSRAIAHGQASPTEIIVELRESKTPPVLSIDRYLLQTSKSFAAIGKATVDMRDDLKRLGQKVSQLDGLYDKMEVANLRLAAKNHALKTENHELMKVAAEHDRLSACLEHANKTNTEIKDVLLTAIITLQSAVPDRPG